MQIRSPFHIYECDNKTFIVLVFSFQLILLGLIGLDYINLKIPIFRQLFGFLYLTFVPGIVILRVMNLHKLGDIEALMYIIGSSLASLMLVGLLLNYFKFLISRPISTYSLLIIMITIISILSIASIKKNRYAKNYPYINLKDISIPTILALFIIPFLSIFATYLFNFYNDNSLMMILIIIIAFIIILVGFDFIPKKLYPLSIFIISIAILYHNSLISMYLWGWDIQSEYYISNLVIKNGYWDSTIFANINSVLSVVMITPIYSIIGNIELIWVFKIIYPFLYALVPLGLYHIFRNQTNAKIAFLSSFLFVSIFPFFTEMLGLARQEIAEVFLVIMFLLIFDKNINISGYKKAVLLILFEFSFIVSHYGLYYIFMIILISIWLIFYLNIIKDNNRNIKTVFISLYIVFGMAWYLYVSNSSVFDALINLGDRMVNSISTDFLNTQSTSIVINIAISPMREIAKYLHLISQFLITIGILTSLKFKNMKGEYSAIAYVNFIILIIGLAIPYFAAALNTTRLYHITIIFLAPFCITGGKILLEAINKIIRLWDINFDILKILSIYLSIFILFNTGFVIELAKEPSSSISLNNSFDYPRFDDREILAGKWIENTRNEDIKIYSDSYRSLLLQGLTGERNYLNGSIDKNQNVVQDKMPNRFYLFFGHKNIMGTIVLMTNKGGSIYTNIQNLTLNYSLPNYNKIYDNQGAYIYNN